MNKTVRALIFFFILCAGFTTTTAGQTTYEIEGSVFDNEIKEPIPFANINNKSLEKGTISNVDGFFRITVSASTDLIEISAIGYEDQFIALNDSAKFYTIILKSKAQMLDDFVVKPADNSYLVELLRKCRKNTSVKRESKAYYELKTFIAGDQVELVEGYYNLGVKGYKLTDLNLKAGRIALQNYDNRFFASLESSRAVLMFNLFDENEYFPVSPLELSAARLKKHFYFNLNSKYLDNSDSVYVIGFQPKDTSGNFFSGTVYINKTKSLLVKINLEIANTNRHPFLPMFPNDSISGISLDITQTFTETNGSAVFNHMDFIYKTYYKSRLGKAHEQNYSVRTNAVLYAYDYDHSFLLPIFQFSEHAIGDYRKINAMPYNDFFWKFNDEYRVNDSLNSNELFFSDPRSLTSRSLFKTNKFSKRKLFEHPFVSWSKNRIVLRELLADTTLDANAVNFKTEQYNLSVKVFLDFNSYSDSSDIITATIIDPFESYYQLPMDNQTHCFINIFFDLCEIERRRLEEKLLKEKPRPEKLKEIYAAFLKEFEAQKMEYLNAAQRGTNEKAITKYNNIVHENLGINNIELYHPFPER